MTSNIIFQKHIGTLHHISNNVQFYGLIFKSIIEAIHYLKHIEPGPYDSWEYNGTVGLYMEQNNIQMFLVNGTWYNQEAFKELLSIQ